MEVLYGVYHGAQARFPFSDPVVLKPSRELLMELSSLPRRSIVGIESFSRKDWVDVGDHLEGLVGDIYMDSFPDFWDPVIEALQYADVKIVYMENKDVWKNYNERMGEFAEVVKVELVHKPDESDVDYHTKLVRRNEAKWKANVRVREVHEIERDNNLLEQIPDLDVAIVGLAHSDYWVAKELISPERYAADCSPKKKGGWFYNTFEINRSPDPKLVFERDSLKRKINFIDLGRIMGEVPDFVGTWNRENPSDGYFEMFIDEKHKGKMSGRIEDHLGSATFSGKIKGKRLEFTKVYVDSNEDAINEGILYLAQGKEDFHGHYFNRGMGTPFYMKRSNKLDPFDMGMRLYALFEKKKIEYDWIGSIPKMR